MNKTYKYLFYTLCFLLNFFLTMKFGLWSLLTVPVYVWIDFKFMSSHNHEYKLKYTQEEVWAECSCGKQLDIPDERLYEAYSKLRECDLFWKV